MGDMAYIWQACCWRPLLLMLRMRWRMPVCLADFAECVAIARA
eukprot:COSAG05_NODE_2180_length_3432_cov_2.161416_2_plen_43_part_00